MLFMVYMYIHINIRLELSQGCLLWHGLSSKMRYEGLSVSNTHYSVRLPHHKNLLSPFLVKIQYDSELNPSPF